MSLRSSTRTTYPKRTAVYRSADGAARGQTAQRGSTTSCRRAASLARASGSSPNHDCGTSPTRKCSGTSESGKAWTRSPRPRDAAHWCDRPTSTPIADPGILNSADVRYTSNGWGELSLAAAGATAALSSLIFVGLSVNIGAVLELCKREGSPFLTGRAIEALVALLNVLVVSIIALTPTRVLLATRGQPDVNTTNLLRLATAVALTLTLVLSGGTLAAGAGGGLFWLPAAFVVAILVAAVNAWVLLVEILR